VKKSQKKASKKNSIFVSYISTVIGYETSEQLDVEPANYFVRVTKREKRACKACEEQGVQTAPLPARIIDKGLASDRVIIDTVVSKYLDHFGLLGDVLSGRLRSLEPLMDLLLLPLAFHVMLLVLAAFAPWTPARLAGFGGLLIVLVHLIVAIGTSGGDWRDVMALLASPC